jgi:hypothetical protein
MYQLNSCKSAPMLLPKFAKGQAMETRRCQKCHQIDWQQGFHIPCNCNRKDKKWRRLAPSAYQMPFG